MCRRMEWLILQEFFDCQCMEEGTATLGLCERHCGTFTVYLVAVFAIFFVTSMTVVPMMTAIMR